MRLYLLLITLMSSLILTGCVSTKINANKLPRGVKLAKSIQIPAVTKVAYYLPYSHTTSRFYLDNWNVWVEPGKALSTGVDDVFSTYFGDAQALDKKSDDTYGLLIDLDPEWEFSSGKAHMTMTYKVYNDNDKVIRKGKKTYKADIGQIGSGTGLYNAAMRATQLVVVDILNNLTPDSSNLTATKAMKNVDPLLLANMEKPVSSGTGFYINEHGQILTAAHVLDHCMVAKIHDNNNSYDAQVEADSNLLDLAVVGTGQPREAYLPLRKNAELFLGEPVTNVGYPLQGLLAVSPNLTRGNVSSHTALKGSVGLFQFSAPIQPGSSGGPVVSDGGELIGITVSTLNAAALIESGALPQNVNFALNAKYAAKFLQRNNIPFKEVEPNLEGNIRTSNKAALSAVVQLACYQ
ncbi:trypsin-like peptidase domain-containing protein [Shewanella sp. KX20019]|uniref:S1 family peptidase n=1 Tax=Shewanella sp. KX20019 TaxID=2803864 RepID=UPI0019258E94|nr:serine protease [Shewanella sp. KX20019]QQX80751.1 trypsin-like peptidase domain-containing protein [Shewanella sp. KX20019]